jgi:DNA polymerase-3 subunit gamma/tau
MEYLVLARKYRPQTFEEMVGQEHVTRTLANAIARGRIHHAFLFTGGRGVGKTTAARILAKALCCQKGPTPTPCNECDACKQIRDGSAIDVVEIDGASNNGVDNIRELREAARYQPAHLRRKVYILDEVHMLSSGAFNALLKTLEEPPPHVVFVFATTEAHKIPITILSRCQRYDFKLLPVDRLRGHLQTIVAKEGIAADPGAIGLIAREAGGSARDALSLLDQVIAFVGGEEMTEARVAEALGVADHAVLAGLANAVIDRDGRAALSQLDAACDRGYELLPLVRAFLGVLRDLGVAKMVADPAALLDGSSLAVDELQAMAGRAGEGVLPLLFDRTARALEEAAKSNVPRLILEMALLDLVAVEPMLPLGDLIERLESMEGRVAGGEGSSVPRPSGGPVGGGSQSPRRSQPGESRPATRAGVDTAPVAPVASGESSLSTLLEKAPAAPESRASTAAMGGAAALVSASTAPAESVLSIHAALAPAPKTARAVAPVVEVAPAVVVVPTPPPPPMDAPAPPESVAAPTPISESSPDDVAQRMARWEKVLQRLESTRPTVAAQLALARVSTLTAQRCEISVPHGSLLADLLAEAEHKKALTDAVTAEMGGSPLLVVRAEQGMPIVDESVSLAEVEERRRLERQKKRERDARSHPIVKAAIDTFGAEIKEIRPIKADEP